VFSKPQPQRIEEPWKRQLDSFVKENQQELAALSWGLSQQWGDAEETLGINLKPTPHFVSCPKDAIETLNRKVQGQLREMLGIVDGHKPEQEVLIIGIGPDQLKLIQFTPEPAPPECFEQVGADVDTLLDRLEKRLQERVALEQSE
jgi:hypothetical protein